MADNIFSKLLSSFEGMSTGGKIAVVAVGGGAAFLGYRAYKNNQNNPATGGGLGITSGDTSGVPAQSDGGLSGLAGGAIPPQPSPSGTSGIFGGTGPVGPPQPAPGNIGSFGASTGSIGLIAPSFRSGGPVGPPQPAPRGIIVQTGFGGGSSGLKHSIPPQPAPHVAFKMHSFG